MMGMGVKVLGRQAVGPGAAVTEPHDIREPPPRAMTAAAPKLKRRPMLAAGSILAISVGALLGWWLWTSSSGASPAVAMRSSVERGQIIERADLMTVQVGLDPALRVLTPAEADKLVGQRAAVDLPAGSLVTDAALQAIVVPAAGRSVVGVSAGPAALPGEPLLVGDRVQVVVASAQAAAVSAEPWSVPAVVVGVRPVTGAGQANQVVSVEVAQTSAVDLAGRLAAGGHVQIVLESRER